MEPNAVRPDQVIRSRAYLSLLVISAVLGIPIAIFAYAFLWITTVLQKFVYTTIPAHLASGMIQTWWPVIPLTLAGLIVGLIVSRMPGRGGEMPIKGLQPSGTPVAAYLPGVALAAMASIGLGAVIGPEAPLIALGGGLAYLIITWLRPHIEKQPAAIVTGSGSFTAISTLLGSPLVGAFLLLEGSSLTGLTMELALMPGILAAGIGYLIFVGLDSATGLGLFSLSISHLPPYGSPTIWQFIGAIMVGAVGAALIAVLRKTGWSLYPRIKSNVVGYTMLAGFLIALGAIVFTTITGQGEQYVLFSGQDQLPQLIASAAGLSVGTLVLMLVLKSFAYAMAIVSFRGGPTFPAIFLGAALGVLLSHLTGMSLIACIAMGIAATTAAMLRLPLTTILLVTILLGGDGLRVMPITIAAAVVAYITAMRMAPPEPKPVPAGT